MNGVILIVDDDPDIVSFLEEALEMVGYESRTAVGAGALSIAKDEQLRLILLDLQIPGMSGDEVCRRLKADPATATIPVVIMSALDRLTATASLVPADDRLPKPFDLARLIELVNYWSTRRAAPIGGGTAR